MHLSTRRTKLCVVTTAMSIAACTCAVTVPSSVFTQTAEAAPIVSTTSTHAATGPVPSAAGGTRAATTPDPVSVPAAGSLAQPASSTQSGTSLTQPGSSSTTTSANKPVSATAQPVAGNTDDSLTWTKDDFNISADGKTIGGRQNIEHPAHDGKPASTENTTLPGLTEKGFAKLKKNHHLVIPDGVEVISSNSFKMTDSTPQDEYIESVKFPESLKSIGYGAFERQKIKGTVIIPKNVRSVSSGAFMCNKITKVIFNGVIGDTINKTNPSPEYEIVESAFTDNNISEIVFADKASNYRLLPYATLQNNLNRIPFRNQKLGLTTIEVGDKFQPPIQIIQHTTNPDSLGSICILVDNGNPTHLSESKNFKKENDGTYTAIKAGNLEGQYLYYLTANNEQHPLIYASFEYEILPQGSLCTVTFNSENAVLSKIRVRKGKSVTEGAVNGQHMPADPSKKGYEFKGWNTKSDGTGDAFSATTIVNGDWNVFAVFSKNPSPSPSPAPNPGPIPQLNPVPKLQPKPVPAPTPTPDKVPAVQQEAPTKTPIPAPPAPEQPAPVPNDTPAPEPPARPAGEQHVQQARMPRTSDMALLGMLASTSALACALVCGAITALKRRK